MPEERRQEYDPSLLLTRAALLFVGVLILFVAGIIGVQIWKAGEANTESWAALTGLIGWATSQVSVVFNARYGTTQSSQAKDVTIAQQAKTAAVAQAALAPVIAAANGKEIKADEVKVTAAGDVTVQKDISTNGEKKP